MFQALGLYKIALQRSFDYCCPVLDEQSWQPDTIMFYYQVN